MSDPLPGRASKARKSDPGSAAWSELIDLGPRPVRTASGDRRRSYGWSDPQELAAIAPATSGLEFLRKMINGELPSSALSRTLDFDLVEAEAGRVVVSARPAEYQCNAIGTVHGGVVASWADSAMGYAVQSRLPAGVGLTTLDIQVRYVRPVRPDDAPVSVVGTAEHVGRRTATARAELYDEQQRMLGSATTSCLILRR